MTYQLDDGFTLTIVDPNNVLAGQTAAIVKDYNFVVDLLNQYIVFKSPLDLEIVVSPQYGGALGTAVTYGGITTQVATVKAILGIDLNGSAPDGGQYYDSTQPGFLPLWFDPNPQLGVTPAVPTGMEDFISYATHELFHMLGFLAPSAVGSPNQFTFTTINGITYYDSPSINKILGGPLPITDFNDVPTHIGNVSISYQPILSDLMYADGDYTDGRWDIGQLDLLLLQDVGYTIKNYQSLPLTAPLHDHDITGTDGDDVILASKYSSILSGLGGNDQFILPTPRGNGDYLIDGGGGTNSVVLARSYSDFDIVAYGSDYLLQNKTGLDAVSLLRSIQTVQFADATVSLTNPAGLSIQADNPLAILHGSSGNDQITGLPPAWVGSYDYTLEGRSDIFYDPQSHHFYEVVPLTSSTETWTQAETAATQMSLFGVAGHLATITSQHEEQVVEQAIELSGRNSQWYEAYIGLHQVNGSFAWVTNEPVSYTDWSPNMVFQSWSVAAYLSSDGWYAEDSAYNNQSGASSQMAVVEFDLSAAPAFTLSSTYTVSFTGSFEQYQISHAADGSLVVADTVSGRDGTDTLHGIAELQFSDGVWTASTGQMAFTVSAAQASASLDQYQQMAAADTLQSITLTDAGTPVLTLSGGQLAADRDALAKIDGNFTLSVTIGSTVQPLTGFASEGHGTVAIFGGMAASYTVTPAGNGETVTVGANGWTDNLSDFTALQFTDFTELLTQTPGQGTVTTGNIAELYGAVFGRVPDIAGLAFYDAALKANPSLSLVTLATYFMASPEYSGNPAHSYAYTTAGDSQLITDTYQNLLNRAPASGDVSWYLAHVFTPALAGLAAGTAAYQAVDNTARATLITYFSASSEFLTDVGITAQHPANAQHWLLMI